MSWWCYKNFQVPEVEFLDRKELSMYENEKYILRNSRTAEEDTLLTSTGLKARNSIHPLRNSIGVARFAEVQLLDLHVGMMSSHAIYIGQSRSYRLRTGLAEPLTFVTVKAASKENIFEGT
jgi:hypothetical protein